MKSIKRSYILIFIVAASLIIASCDNSSIKSPNLLSAGIENAQFDNTATTSTPLSSAKAAIISKTIPIVANEMITLNIAKIVVINGMSYCVPVKPYTIESMRVKLEAALKKALGGSWQDNMNSFIENNIINDDIPQEVESAVNQNLTGIDAGVPGIGPIQHNFDEIGETGVSIVPRSWLAGAIPFDGVWWPVGATEMDFSFYVDTFNTPLLSNYPVSLEATDAKSKPYQWFKEDKIYETIYDADVINPIAIHSKAVYKLLGYPKLYITSFTITSFAGGVQEVWCENYN